MATICEHCEDVAPTIDITVSHQGLILDRAELCIQCGRRAAELLNLSIGPDPVEGA